VATRFSGSASMGDAAKSLTTDLLRQVSRSFYLTLRILPQSIRPQISLAYLLARTSDTIADTEIVPPDHRCTALDMLRQRILGNSHSPVELDHLTAHQGSPAERILLERCEESLALLHRLVPDDRRRVQNVLEIIICGQELDLKRFAGASGPKDGRAPNVIALQTDEELDHYTWQVAGCVGEFWSRMCRAHLFADAPEDEEQWFANGIRFGKGLQIINILQDIPNDLRQGRCYIPTALLATAGLRPADLLNPGMEPKFRPVCNLLINRAEKHLATGWHYTNQIPASQFRVRLACTWPILIGVRTIALLRKENVLAPARRIKTPRAEVRRLILNSLWRLPFPGAYRRLWVPGSAAGESC
jgi:farnesyl-diphosphate farnesyltransferase